jgi:hypothetical protein
MHKENVQNGQRSDELLLNGDVASRVSAAAKAVIGDGTIVRIETDAEGFVRYVAHMTDAEGSPVTVYVGDDFEVVTIESR